jgi:hypothetical protein
VGRRRLPALVQHHRQRRMAAARPGAYPFLKDLLKSLFILSSMYTHDDNAY